MSPWRRHGAPAARRTPCRPISSAQLYASQPPRAAPAAEVASASPYAKAKLFCTPGNATIRICLASSDTQCLGWSNEKSTRRQSLQPSSSVDSSPEASEISSTEKSGMSARVKVRGRSAAAACG